MENISQFKKAQEENLKEVRNWTTGENSHRQYGNISSDIRSYEYRCGTGESILNIAEKKHAAHPERPVAILDFGCGENQALRELRRETPDDMPIEMTGWSVGDPRNGEDRRFDDAHGIKFADQTKVTETPPTNSYDIIISRMAFTHLPNPLQTMKKLYNALRDDGLLFIDMGRRELKFKFKGGEKDLSVLFRGMKKAGIDFTCDDFRMSIRKNDKDLKFPGVTIATNAEDNGKAIYGIKKNDKKD
jgi:SAM-dependent methyltransferase